VIARRDTATARHCEPVRVKQSRILIISVMDWLTPKNWIASCFALLAVRNDEHSNRTSLRGMSVANDEAIQKKGKTNEKSGLLR
ncbi:MAG: hypothetical protein LBH30_04880, partial [Prevotellaceae bacterium]|nr:hypothetical protein [Prevotellaceae bacterium]